MVVAAAWIIVVVAGAVVGGADGLSGEEGPRSAAADSTAADASACAPAARVWTVAVVSASYRETDLSPQDARPSTSNIPKAARTATCFPPRATRAPPMILDVQVLIASMCFTLPKNVSSAAVNRSYAVRRCGGRVRFPGSPLDGIRAGIDGKEPSRRRAEKRHTGIPRSNGLRGLAGVTTRRKRPGCGRLRGDGQFRRGSTG